MVGVPCNQFGHQEPAANRTELLNGLRYVRPGAGFSPLFNLSHPALVNGEGELELYTYLKVKREGGEKGREEGEGRRGGRGERGEGEG